MRIKREIKYVNTTQLAGDDSYFVNDNIFELDNSLTSLMGNCFFMVKFGITTYTALRIMSIYTVFFSQTTFLQVFR